MAAKDADRFWSSIVKCFVILVVAVPIYVYYYYVRGKLGLFWRRGLTRFFSAAIELACSEDRWQVS